MVNDQIILLLAAITAAFALTVFAWDVEVERLKRENARLRQALYAGSGGESLVNHDSSGGVGDPSPKTGAPSGPITPNV